MGDGGASGYGEVAIARSGVIGWRGVLTAVLVLLPRLLVGVILAERGSSPDVLSGPDHSCPWLLDLTVAVGLVGDSGLAHSLILGFSAGLVRGSAPIAKGERFWGT